MTAASVLESRAKVAADISMLTEVDLGVVTPHPAPRMSRALRIAAQEGWVFECVMVAA